MSVRQPRGDFEKNIPADIDPQWTYDPDLFEFELGNIWISVKWFPYLDEFLDWLLEHDCLWREAYLGPQGYVPDRIVCPNEATATLFKLRWA